MSAKRSSTGRKRVTTATPSPIMTPRSSSAVRMPHLRTRWVCASGTLKYSKIIRKTKRLSTLRLFSTRKAVAKSTVALLPFHGHTTPSPKTMVTTMDQTVAVIACL